MLNQPLHASIGLRRDPVPAEKTVNLLTADILAMGNGNSEKDYHNHAEWFVAAENKWISIEDFPISNPRYDAIYRAPIVFHVDAYYVFGGRWDVRRKLGDPPHFGTTSNEIVRLDYASATWT